MTGVANDWTPQAPRPLTAVEEAMRIIDYTVARLHEHYRLKPEQREEAAREYDAAAERNRAAGINSLADRCGDAARILRAVD